MQTVLTGLPLSQCVELLADNNGNVEMAINTALVLASSGPISPAAANNSNSHNANFPPAASPVVRVPDQVVRERLIEPMRFDYPPAASSSVSRGRGGAARQAARGAAAGTGAGGDSIQAGTEHISVAGELERIYRQHCPGMVRD